MEFKIDYFVLTLLYFFAIFVFGLKARKSNVKTYWKNAIIPIILFSIIEGCRFGRGTDYLWYQSQYYSILNPIEDQEPLFMWIYQVLYLADIPFHLVTIIFAFCWITSVYVFLQDYRDSAPWNILFFLIYSLILFESAIRQFLSLSFVLIAFHFIARKRYTLFAVMAIMACSIHLSSIIYILLLVILSFYKRCFNWKLILGIYLFFVFIWDFSKSDSLVTIFTLLDLGTSKLNSYINNAENWFSANAAQEELIRSFPVKCFSAILDGYVIVYGYKITEKLHRPSLYLLYNLSMIGLLGLYGAFTLEITRRIFHPLFFFTGIIIAYCLKYKKMYLGSAKEFLLVKLVSILVLFLWIKNILLSHAGQLFIWDVPSIKL